MRTLAASVLGSLMVGSLMVGSLIAVAHAGPGNPAGQQGGAEDERSSSRSKGESSPFIVGTWKFIPGSSPGAAPLVDTEFRFLNPTDVPATIEYAFFEQDGTFCGCDRDDFTPTARTVHYTVLEESLTPTPRPTNKITRLFSCHDTSGALKSIVFRHDGSRIFFDDATQVGFQTHAFGDIREPATTPSFPLLRGAVMTEAGMKGIAVTDSTTDDARAVHELCVTVQGQL